jgi:post-segregation antitoxin (ccd killing protein)
MTAPPAMSEQNRQAMPQIAAFVDELRAQGFKVEKGVIHTELGEPIATGVLYASENGVTKGRKPKEPSHA